MISDIRFISAGAGTGKTFRLTEELEKALVEHRITPQGVIGTTFTNKAAAELRERVRERLIRSGYGMLANQMGQALLGTVNSICGTLLGRFAFEIGLSPQLQVIPEEDVQLMFNRTLDDAVPATDVRRLNELSFRMGFKKQWDKKDWRTDLKEIVSAARANNVSPDDLDAWGETSAGTILSHFPNPSNEDLWNRLEHALNEALGAIPAKEDQTRATQKYISFLHDQKTRITERRLPWSDWVKLSKETPAQKSREASEEIRTAAAFYDRHPQLHEDIQNYCRTLFKVAAEALRKYQETKERLGMIDFIDQEQRLLYALERPEVFEPLKEELELLLVDEFQDTSPIQLALFLKLAEAAREAVFVGDIKQAIYGFRGSDPDLMLAVQREIEHQGDRIHILQTSYRSRPALVDYTNALFIPAFSSHIPEDQVRLTPFRKEVAADPAVAHWILCGNNAASHHDALALGIERLVGSGYRVEDKESRSPRKVRHGDIAVLARTNYNVSAIARTLAKRGIPIQMERPGLLQAPEARLALACLRRLADANDTLAGAEIVSLSDCSAPETWIEERLRYLESETPEQDRKAAEGFEHPVLGAISRTRDRIRELSPSEVLSAVMDAAQVRHIVSTWGPNSWRVRQRLQNLNALIGFAEKFEDHCVTHQKAATIAGLLNWLEKLKTAKLDTQPGDPGSDAVHILTHHRAKGLEWPVVIAMDLNSDLKSQIWGLNVISENPRVDLQNPLSGRSLRFWPYPFGGQRSEIPVVETLNQSEIGKTCAQRDKAESIRLLYVSLTRARDLLVIPLPGKKPTGEWMELLQAGWMLPAGDTLALPDGNRIPLACWKLDASEKQDTGEPAPFQPFWFSGNQAFSEKLPAVLNPSGVAPCPEARIAARLATGTPLHITDTQATESLGTFLHHVLAAEAVNPLQKDALEKVENAVACWGLSRNLDAGAVLVAVRDFFRTIRVKFKPRRTLAEYPVTHVLQNGQFVNGWVDLILETENGWVIIDHKFTEKTKDDLDDEALKYSGQLKAYKDAVEAATAKTVIACWIHFLTHGEMLQVEFQ